MDALLLTLALAYGTDLVLGDPRWLPHPVRAMGVAIASGEWILRRLIPWQRLAGVCLVIGVVGGGYGLSSWLLATMSGQSPAWGFVISVFLLYTCFSTRDLAVESYAVLAALDANDLPQARRNVSRIVGRDTAALEEPEIVRATVETIAESTLDGILAPLFWTVVGGVPLAVAYKAVNTLDSMIGHRSARYLHLGAAAATLDTWANWIPARWSAVVFPLAARVTGFRARESWRCAWRDGSGGPVPNAGIPEAAMAGALGVRLGGVNWYGDRAVGMPFMGIPTRPLAPARITEAIRIMYAASVIGWLTAMAAVWIRPW